MKFTPQEKAFCVIAYAKQESPSIVQRQFRTRFGDRHRKPSRASILQWYDEYQERGSSERKKRINTRWVRTELKEAEVIESFRNNVNKSTTELAREDGMPSQPTIWRILNEAKFHPYKMNLRQELLPVNA
uniref:DUF4817 domain-containing protein n=1 Tax=Ditylenchus dipsaci TaxID=166011 RepID=A0A915ELI6_9BILA